MRSKKRGRAENLKPNRPGGRSPNPEGKTNSDLAAVRRLTRENVAEIGSLLLKATEEDLERYCEDANIPMISKMIARCLRKGSRRADTFAMRILLEEICGRVPQKTDVTLSPHAALVKMLEGSGDEEETEE